MKKEIVQVKSSEIDVIIGIDFDPVYLDGKPVYIDDGKKIKGHDRVGSIWITIPIYGEQGILNFQKIYLIKEDILIIYNKINEIESRDAIGQIEDNLPF